MSSVESPRLIAGARPVESEALLGGWGRTSPSRARLLRPRTAEELAARLAQAPPRGGAIARGAGRSYGDPAQNAGGTVLDMRGLAGIRAIDREAMLVGAGAGTTFGELLAQLAPHGLTLPVVPGTRHLTVGGAIAADVHGKNHARAGSIGSRLASLTLCTPAGECVELAADPGEELFAATVGGMGLTGAITAATLQAVPLRRPYAVADIDRVAGLEEAIEAMLDGEHSHSIAWLDLMAPGAGFARAVVTRSSEGPQQAAGPLRLARSPRLAVPPGVPGGLLRPAAVRAFNLALWQRAPRRARGHALEIDEQLFPLDRVEHWNRLYGPAGLIQYQFAVPAGGESTLREVLELLRRERLPMYLSVLKRFGRPSGGMLSFPVEGWTLAIDLPAGAPGLRRALDRADELVAAAAGRVYLAKDARLRPEALAAMYPQLERFRELRGRLDPDGALRSDMARRLELCA